jgi:RNA polymerase sigma factor (sigma-70 family)
MRPPDLTEAPATPRIQAVASPVGGVEGGQHVLRSGSHEKRGYRGALSSYLGAIRRYKLLTRSGEQRIATESHQGIEAAKNELVEANLRVVVKLAKELRNDLVGLDDLIAEGNLGLIEAAGRYDPGRGVRFISYATWWIRKYMLLAIDRQAHQTSTPKPRSGDGEPIGRHARRVRMSSLDTFGSADDGRAALEAMASLATEPSEDIILGADLRKALHSVISKLPLKERQILARHFGLDGEPPKTLQQIGDELNLTRERVRQIELRALGRVRRLLSGGRSR